MSHVTTKDISHWIIFSPSRGTIWQGPFMSYVEAAHELDYRKSHVPNYRGDWLIQEHTTSMLVSEGGRVVKDEFNDF